MNLEGNMYQFKNFQLEQHPLGTVRFLYISVDVHYS